MPAKQGGLHNLLLLLYITVVSQSYTESSLHVAVHRELHLRQCQKHCVAVRMCSSASVHYLYAYTLGVCVCVCVCVHRTVCVVESIMEWVRPRFYFVCMWPLNP